MADSTQAEINEIRRKIEEIVARGDTCFFRGEAKEYEEISSPLYRAYRDILNEEEKSHPYIMDNIQVQIITGVTPYFAREEYNAIVEDIQQHGGDTNLIDFSSDYLIALFFACDGRYKEDGRLIVYRLNIEDRNVKFFFPNETSKRIEAHKGVSVYPLNGVLEVEQEHIIPIPAKHKKPILEFLRTYHGITYSDMYPDIHDYIRQNHIVKEAYTRLYHGYHYRDQGLEYTRIMMSRKSTSNGEEIETYRKKAHIEYRKAIDEYTAAIEMNPWSPAAYFHRAFAYGALTVGEQNEKKRHRQYENSLKDCHRGTKLDPRNPDSYLTLFRFYEDFYRHTQSDAEKQRVYELLQPIVDRALRLAGTQGDKRLKKQVQEYYNEYCVQPPQSTPTE